MTQLTLTIPRRLTQDVADFAEASSVYAQARDLSGEGGSTFPDGVLDRHGEFVARVSYNGRVWASREWHPGERPLCEAADGGPVVINEEDWANTCQRND